MTQASSIIAIVPAAGVGRRMGAERPKQYLQINEATVLEHTVYKLLSHPNIAKVVVVVGKNDPYFSHLSLAQDDRVAAVIGGDERADSVLAGVKFVRNNEDQAGLWFMMRLGLVLTIRT